MDRRFDPRSIVTPYAFAVHPDLLGVPLATPWQRLGAIFVDLIIIGFISQIGVGPLAVASTLLLFFLATRKTGRDVFGKVFRVAAGCLGFLVLTGTVLVALLVRHADDLEDLVREATNDSTFAVSGAPRAGGSTGPEETLSENVGLLDFVQSFRGAMELQRAGTEDEAQTLLNEFAQGAFDAGLSRGQTRELMSDLIPEEASWASVADDLIDQAMAGLSAERAEGAPPRPEAMPQEESLDVGTPLPPEAEDSIARLNRALQLAREDQDDLSRALQAAEEDLEAERNEGPLAWIWGLIDELGIGFGWAALYMTITHAWWRGTSIGKKLFRIRVVMIDKRPLNWWLSFERAGGYAAGFATGLLGFAQVFWDPNRQAIHDKVSETIVIRDGEKAVPGPWIEEGRAQWKRGRAATTGGSGG